MSAAPVIVLTGMALEARIALGIGTGPSLAPAAAASSLTPAAAPGPAPALAPDLDRAGWGADAAPELEVIFGLRGEALASALAERLRRPCAGVISFGMAGGLSPGLPAGAILLAHGVATHSGALQTDPTWSSALHATLHATLRATLPTSPPIATGLLAGVDAPLTTPQEKAALHRATGAQAVDMESHIAARIAHANGIPFAVCRVIIDPAQRSVPPAALSAFGEDGSVALAPLLRELLRHPAQLPALLQLASDASRARASLRLVRAELGPRFGR